MAELSVETHEAGYMISGFGSGWGSLGTAPAPGTVTAPTLDPIRTDLGEPVTGGLTPGTVAGIAEPPASVTGGSCCSACAGGATHAPAGPAAVPGGAVPVSALSAGAPTAAGTMGAGAADLLDFAKRHWWWLLLLLFLLSRRRR